MPKDVYLQPSAADPILAEAVVLTIARKYLPVARAVTSVEESGGEARAYLIDQDLVLKVQRPHRLRPRTNLEKEAFFLNQLATNPDIRVPKVLGYGREGDNIEYILMTRMPGKAFRQLKLEGEVRKAALYALGQTLHKIHGLSQQEFTSSSRLPGDQTFAEFRVRLEELAHNAVLLIEPKINSGQIEWNFRASPAHLAQKALKQLPQEAERVALHSNPGPEHTFINPADNTFSGLIDFGDAYVSHPALDLRRWPYPDDRAVLLEGYISISPVSENFLKTWQLVMFLTDLAILANSSDAKLVRAVEEDLQAKLA